MKTKDYFVQTDSLGNGINLTTNEKWELSISDMYINPLTETLVIFYLSPTKKEMIHSTTDCKTFGTIKITEL